MRKLKEVLRLHSLGLSQHQIARSYSISQRTVHEYSSAAQAAGVKWPALEHWDDQQIVGANSSRPTGSFRQRPKPQKPPRAGKFAASRQRKPATVLTDADHYLKLRESCVASLRSDRHEIGMTDRHHRNPQSSATISPSITISSGIFASAAATHEYRAGTPLSLRERSRTLPCPP
jgi:hypothetical protein